MKEKIEILFYRQISGKTNLRYALLQKENSISFFCEEEREGAFVSERLENLSRSQKELVLFAEKISRSKTSPLVLREIFEDYDWDSMKK